MRNAVKKYFALHYGILIGLFVLCAVTSIMAPNFLQVSNFSPVFGVSTSDRGN